MTCMPRVNYVAFPKIEETNEILFMHQWMGWLYQEMIKWISQGGLLSEFNTSPS